MANQFLKVDVKGVPALINKSHIVIAQFGSTLITKIHLISGEIIEVTHTAQLFQEMQF